MSTMRITGLSSGFDTEQMIKDLMKAENTRVDKIKKEKQYATWQQDAYRGIIDKLRNLQSTYFDVLKPKSNLASTSSFSQFSYSVSSGGEYSNAVSITAAGLVTNRNQVIEKIDNLATKDSYKGNDTNLRGIKISLSEIQTLKAELDTEDFKMTLSVGSNAKVITISNGSLSDGMTAEAFETLLRTEIESEFGTDYTNLIKSSGTGLEFDMPGNDIKVLDFTTGNPSLSALGLSSGQSNTDYKTKSVGTLFGFTASEVTINNKKITLDPDETIEKMVSRINKSDLGVEMSYDTLSDKFVINATKEGSSNDINLDANAKNFFASVLNTEVSGLGSTAIHTSAINARLRINGVDIVQNSNNFTYDGVTYTLNAKSTEPINLSITTNTTEIVNNIKNFVEAYNSILDDINGKLSEKRNYDYEPLTDEDKEAMSEEDIKKWEDAAKLGVLRGASELSGILLKMRNAMVEQVEGVGLSLAEIGIKSENYSSRGKLVINEELLKSKLESNYDDIVKLFTNQSEISYDSGNSSKRSNQNGIGERLNDILKDYVRTTRGSNNQKGILLIKAGIINDTSATQNDISKRITSIDTRISNLLEVLSNKEDYYYRMFSRMESALSEMQNQSSSLMSMLGTN